MKIKLLLCVLLGAGVLSGISLKVKAGELPFKEVPEAVSMAAEKYGKEYGIAPEFLEAMAFYESSFNPKAVNGGCMGLMQVNPKWHKERIKRLKVSNLYSLNSNMMIAADYLAELFAEYQDPAVVLMVYNGDSRAEKFMTGKADMSEYAAKILRLSEVLERKNGK